MTLSLRLIPSLALLGSFFSVAGAGCGSSGRGGDGDADADTDADSDADSDADCDADSDTDVDDPCLRFGFVANGGACTGATCESLDCECPEADPRSITSCTTDGCIVEADCDQVCAAPE